MNEPDQSGTADVEELRSFVQRLGVTVHNQQDGLQKMEEALNQIGHRMRTLPDPGSPIPTFPAPVPTVKVSPPPPFSGEPAACKGFLTQCSLIFELQPANFPTERSKVAYIIPRLIGKALDWATALWTHRQTAHPVSGSWVLFSESSMTASLHGWLPHICIHSPKAHGQSQSMPSSFEP